MKTFANIFYFAISFLFSQATYASYIISGGTLYGIDDLVVANKHYNVTFGDGTPQTPIFPSNISDWQSSAEAQLASFAVSQYFANNAITGLGITSINGANDAFLGGFSLITPYSYDGSTSLFSTVASSYTTGGDKEIVIIFIFNSQNTLDDVFNSPTITFEKFTEINAVDEPPIYLLLVVGIIGLYIRKGSTVCPFFA